MKNNQIQITEEGLKTLKSELDSLLNDKRPKLVDRLSNARSQGDLAENSDYSNAKEELEFLDGRITEIEDVLQHAVVSSSDGKSGSVNVGNKVTLKIAGKEHIYHIVGEWEADPMNKKVSNTSPIGQALMGRKVGDKVEVEAPVGKVTYEIISVE